MTRLSRIGSATGGRGQKKVERLGAHLVFIDESGFLLIPNLKRTWAPRGQTPTVVYNFKHRKISAITALAISPKRRRIALYLRFQRRASKGQMFSVFYALFWSRLPVLWWWCGMAPAFIETRSSKRLPSSTHGFTWKHSQAMPQTSTRPSTSGHMRMGVWPTVCSKTKTISCGGSTMSGEGSPSCHNSFGRAFELLIYRGNGLFHYLREIQE